MLARLITSKAGLSLGTVFGIDVSEAAGRKEVQRSVRAHR
jgi:hypothetical protein